MKQDAIAAFALTVWIMSFSQNLGRPSAGVSKKESSADAQLAESAREKQQAAETAALNSILATIAKNEQERAAERQQEAAIESENVRFQRWMIGLGIAQTIALIGTLIAVWYQAKKTADAAKATNEATSAINAQIGLMERQTRSIHHQAVQVRKQTLILNDSAKATQKAAEAALLNAQAVINSERPWIVVNLQEFPKTEEVFTFRITNKGRTPAKIISGTSDFMFADSMDGLPEKPNYIRSFIYPYESFLIQDGYFDIIPPINPEAIIKQRSISDKMFNSTQILFLYGRIVYEDVLGKGRPDSERHDTRWCFAYDGTAGFIRTGST